MPRLVLHIGRSKTGSTSIQEFLALNRAPLAAHGVTVADIFSGPNHVELALAFSAQPGRLARAQGVKSDADRTRLRDRLDHRLRQRVRPGSVWVMTSEHMSSRLRSPEELTGLRELLARHFDRIEVVVYLRRPDHLAPSSYAEAVKSGRTGALNASFVDRHRNRFDHAALLHRWSQVFETVTARPYLESFKSEPHALVSDLLGQVGGIPTVEGFAWPAQAANPSVSAEGIGFLRLVNPYVPVGPLTQEQRRTLVAEVRDRCDGPPLRLTPSAEQALRDADLLTGGLRRESSTDAAWLAWFDAPPAPTGRQQAPAPRRLVALMADLSAPHGPIVWGGRHVPRWIPTEAVDTLRTAVVRLVRR
jgi:hypothetical protein